MKRNITQLRKMALFNRVTIIGLGLIGGSLGLAIRRNHIANEVIGVARRSITIRRAVSLRAVDIATLDLKNGIKGSDLIILATPVLKIVEIMRQVAPLLARDTIVIDAGSTKKYIVEAVEKILPKGVYFIGSHPLAGSEKSGIINADEGLFRKSCCILTRTNKTDIQALAKIRKFWRGLGMKISVMSPDEHDVLVSRISHLPHLVAVSLVNAVSRIDLKLAAAGFRDTTRIASGEPEVWGDIFFTNKENILNDIDIFIKELYRMKSALRNNDQRALFRRLNEARLIRNSLK